MLSKKNYKNQSGRISRRGKMMGYLICGGAGFIGKGWVRHCGNRQLKPGENRKSE
jgi:hypothetical protein